MRYLLPSAAPAAPAAAAESGKGQKHVILFIATLVAILFVGTWSLHGEPALAVSPSGSSSFLHLILLIIFEAIRWFSRDEQRSWLEETWSFMKKIFPLLFIGIFAAGVISALLPRDFLGIYLGSNTVTANLMRSSSGLHVLPDACRGADGKDVP